MQKKLTITIDEDVYEALHRVVGRGHISKYIESLVQPQLTNEDLESGYCQMAEDEEREAESVEWSEALIGEMSNEPR